MRRLWSLFAVFAALTAHSRGDAQPPIAQRDGKLVIPFKVSPIAFPTPALKYRLLPQLRDLETGNQIPAFYKCFMEQHEFYKGKEPIAERERWSKAPLADLANEQKLVGYGGSSTRQADYAARLDSVDWAVLPLLKRDGLSLLLPDVQQMRALALVLKVKLRGEVARKDFNTAIRTAQTSFALARTFEEHPVLIGNLVGIAIEFMTLDVLEEFTQQPGAPNLFWALADLPHPLVGLRKGMQGERIWLTKEFDIFRKPVAIPPEELKRFLDRLDPHVFDVEGKKSVSAIDYYTRLSTDPAAVSAAKERLAKMGHKAETLDKIPLLQVMLMDNYAAYEVLIDDLMKWNSYPFWQLRPDADRKVPPGLFTQLVPATQKVREAAVRIQQRVEMLKISEAIRAYAAENSGKLPANLEAIKLPLPLDPVTGKPFLYEVKDGTAVVTGTPPPNRKNDPNFCRTYEITIRK